jgi:alkylation response protein AidB-like acyl-CoA dehydrogenase
MAYEPFPSPSPQVPKSPSLATASALAERLAQTAVARDRAGGTAKAERDLVRASGLLSLSIPRELGGAGAGWPEVMQVVRRLARVDGSIAHLFGFHHLLLATVRLFGTPEQARHYFRETARFGWFWGNALNPLDPRTHLLPEASGYQLRGAKSFCSGATDSNMLVVSATEPGASKLAIAVIPTERQGIHVHDDWDAIGQRQTDSGTVTFEDVPVAEPELLRTPGPLGSAFASLRPCIAQLVLVNVYAGIAEGALDEARSHTRVQGRAWFASGVATPAQDPYVLRTYGELWVALEGARALADRAAEALQQAWTDGDALTAEGRGACAVAIAAAKVAATRAGLDATSRMFEVIGARATSGAARLDRFWRNLRTHTLHDPVEYKLRELGDRFLNDAWPAPTFYS